jgi:hypothetical protein
VIVVEVIEGVLAVASVVFCVLAGVGWRSHRRELGR